jgi:hypothetical protein
LVIPIILNQIFKVENEKKINEKKQKKNDSSKFISVADVTPRVEPDVFEHKKKVQATLRFPKK